MKKELLELSNKIINAVYEANKRFIKKSKAAGKKIIVSQDGEVKEIDLNKLK